MDVSTHSRPRLNVVIRIATSADGRLLAPIYNEAISSGCSTMDTIPVDTTYFATLLAGFTPRESILVAEQDLGIMAWGIIKHYSDRPGYVHACETSVFVARHEQGQGVGTALQTAIIQKARDFGYRHLVAKILAVNAGSIRFHQGFQYEVVGTQREIGFLNGAWHNVVIMQRVLNDVQPTERT